MFAFLMKYQNLNFGEAVRELAELYNIPLPNTSKQATDQTNENKKLRDQLFRVNEIAARYFYDMLKSPQGEPARKYFENRRIGQEIIHEFSLGYAPVGWRNLLAYMDNRNIPLDVVEKAGLIIPKKDGYYDRFRGRIIFPILDSRDRIIGFGGRTLSDDTPKYLNSPETPVYHKGRSLYGLGKGKTAIRGNGCLVLVEGYMDALALVSHGIRNVAATLGTALTSDQVRLIKRASPNVIVAFDSDEAGKKAVIRNAPLFFGEGIKVTVLTLPPGDDPDDFLNREGKDSLLRRLEDSESLMDFCLKEIIDGSIESPAEQTAALEEIRPIITAMKNELEQNRCIKLIAERWHVAEAILLRAIKTPTRSRKVLSEVKPVQSNAAEKYVLGFYLRNPSVGDEILKEKIYTHFEDGHLADILVDALTECRDKSMVNLDKLMLRHNAPETHRMIAEMIFSDNDDEKNNSDKILKDILNTFRRKRLKKRSAELKSKIEAAEKSNDGTLLQSLLAQKEKIIKEKAVIK